ncbi:Beta-glucosidase A [Rubrobacter xylanophilus DSM 9941]|uniref:GH1 family beta-glucosidase n=1 Tax=Rubrobacter xylanophilus TaxID=49319 RepID=UPI001C643DC8|nr:GH1 family beta-glucosidase [Rubrobacter xylanophilus]QYJ15201.1 Beta-glucosidase A [Rubrobacter xylanophilus DSM 9941]
MDFSEGFLWGAATAAYQIEGAAKEDGRGPSIWDTFSHTPGRVYRGDTGDIACDHYHRLEEDLDLMAEIGLRAYRFSVAWPRVQPEGSGPANQKGLDFYRRLVAGLRERSIEPMLTLYHWDLPQALEDRGGWTSRQTSERFAEYAALVYEALSDSVSYWITLNEPWVSAWMGYGLGVHAPGRRSTADALAATHHLLLGHALALEAMRSSDNGNRLGITLNLSPVRAASSEPADAEAARRVDGNANRLYLDPLFRGSYPQDVLEHYRAASDLSLVQEGDLQRIAAPIDFLGVNYYIRHTVRATVGGGTRELPTGMRFADLGAETVLPEGVQTTAMGWPVEPDGLTEILVRVKKEYRDLPVFVTENGCAVYDYVDPEGDVDDVERVSYLEEHFRAAQAAIERGVDLRGYMVWSLLDNFEWAEGYSKRFGLVFVDYGTQRRIPKASARWYAEVIRRGGVGT